MTKRVRTKFPALVKNAPFRPGYLSTLRHSSFTQVQTFIFTPAQKYRTRSRKTFVINQRFLHLHQVPKPYPFSHFPVIASSKYPAFKTLIFKRTHRTRPNKIQIRLSDQEQYLLQQQAAKRNMTVASFMREYALTLKDPAKKRTPPKLDREFMVQFGGACNNFNQLLHQLHLNQNINQPMNFMKLALEVERLNEELSAIYDLIAQKSGLIEPDKNREGI